MNNRENLSFRKPRPEKRQQSFEFITIPIIIVMLLVLILGNITRLVTYYLCSWGIKGYNKSHFYGVKLP